MKKKYNVIKNFFIIISIIILVLLAVLVSNSLKIESASYYDSDYYKKSMLQLDSLRERHLSVSGSLEAGFSKRCITPGLFYSEDNVSEGKFTNITLSGDYARKGRFATGIRDSIFIRVAAMKVADELMIFVGADLLHFPQYLTDAVLSLLHPDGIRREQLFFSPTHTHSSIGGLGVGYFELKCGGPLNENMVRWLSARISQSIRTALEDLKPALIGSGNVAAAFYTHHRVMEELGTKNDDFSYIILEQIEGKKAIIGSFSAHSSILSADNMEICGDYPGYWQRKMENTFADYAIFCAGAMASQGSAGVAGDGFERIRKVGESLADVVLPSATTTPMYDTVVFSAITMKLNLPDFSLRVTKNHAANVKRSMPGSEGATLQALRLNDMVWISTPADFSGEIALIVKNYLYPKGFHANITGFNGNYVGYIVPSKYYFYEHYESQVMGWYGPNMGDYTTDMIRQMANIVIR